MSDFILEYDMLESIAAYSKSLGKRAGEYEESLEKKMISGIASITGPSTGYLQSANDSVRDKVNALKQKSDAFYHYAEQITNLLETAERIDQEVADAITAQREYFLDHHKSLRLDDWKAKLLGLLVDLKNSIPLLGTIADLLEGLNTVIESLGDSIRHWYECEGGKYVIGEIAAIAEACLAVAIFAATFPISTFTGFCLAVGFGIAALNSCVNVKTSYKAAEAAMDGNPALAEIYGKQDTLSDVLRQKNYGNGTMNDLSNFTAGALDVTEAVCITVGMAGQIVNLFKKSYNLLKYRKSLNYSSLQNNLESGSVKLENVIKEEYKNIKNIGLADDTGAVGELEESAGLIKDTGNLEQMPSGSPQTYTADLSQVIGKGAKAREKAIRAIIEEDFPDLSLTHTPEYSPFIRTGIAQKDTGTQIGKNMFSSRNDLRDTIIHEELHHRWWKRGIVDHHPMGSEKEALFYETIRRYKEMRGWN